MIPIIILAKHVLEVMGGEGYTSLIGDYYRTD